jgi:hypothetical protein
MNNNTRESFAFQKKDKTTAARLNWASRSQRLDRGRKMKSLICPYCGCIAHIPERLEEHIKEQSNCEMCGSGTYLYDGEEEPLSFPKENDD